MSFSLDGWLQDLRIFSCNWAGRVFRIGRRAVTYVLVS